MTAPFFDPERIRRERGRAGYEFSLRREIERIKRQHREGKLKGMDALLADPNADRLLFDEGVRNMARERLRQRSATFKALDRALYPHSPREALNVVKAMLSTDKQLRARTPGMLVPEVAAGFGPTGIAQAARDVVSDVRGDDLGWGTALAAAGLAGGAYAGYRGVRRFQQAQRAARLARRPSSAPPLPMRGPLDTPTYQRRYTPGFRQATEEVLRKHPSGGSTVNPRTGESVTSGYAVSPYKDREKVLRRSPSRGDLQVFMTQNRDLLSDPRNMVGTWFDQESKRHFLDVVKVVDDKAEALRIGTQADQRAIFHLDTFTEVPVPGTAIARRAQMLPARREPPRPVGPPKPGSTIAQGLNRDDAVARMRQLNAAKVNAQMQRQPDGRFKIVAKGEPGQRQPIPTEERTTFGPRGESLESGFQSRLLTVLQQDENLPERATLDEWYNRLKNHPGLSRAELDEVLRPGLANWWDPKKREWIKVEDDLEAMRRLLGGADSVDDQGRISRDALVSFTEDRSPVTRLRRTTLIAEGGQEMPDHIINEEAQYQWEREQELLREELASRLSLREGELKEARDVLRGVFGDEGGERAFKHITEPMTPERSYGDWDDAELAGLDTEDFSGLEEAQRRLHALIDDPSQFAMPGFRAAQLSADDLTKIGARLSRSEYHLNEAIGNAHSIEHGPDDWDHYRAQAVDALQETGEWQRKAGDTQYSGYQRVDPAAPYREILVENPALSEYSRPTGHFRGVTDEPVQAWARGEIHDPTFLMIEAQSDVAQGMRRHPGHYLELRGAGNPFIPTERWAQLSTGAAMRQAAEEGMEHFAWVTPENRRAQAGLSLEAGQVTYGQAVPEAVRRTFRWLDEPMPEIGPDPAGGFPSVELTPAMREKIMRAGVPVLSAAPGLLGAGLLARERLRRNRRGLLAY